jgi:L-asparaginase/Glu-tRNA(Gln) amidotransferase subunit D
MFHVKHFGTIQTAKNAPRLVGLRAPGMTVGQKTEHSMPPARLIILSTGGTIAMTKETAQGGAATTLCAANLIPPFRVSRTLSKSKPLMCWQNPARISRSPTSPR